MKKFILLTIVLALVSSASATLTWKVDGGDASAYVAVASDTVTLSLVDTGAATAITIGTFSDGGAGGLMAVPATLNVKFTQGITTGYVGTDLGYDAGTIAVITGAYDAPNTATGTLVSFSYTLPSVLPSSDIIFTAGDITDYGYVSSVSYTTGSASIPGMEITIPEPMTIALLGLGGLFLRRKLS